MKILRIVFFLLPLLLSNGSIYSQWLQQYSGTNLSLYDVEFLNKNTGYIIGDGVIIKTTNGGDNWINQQSPLTDRPLENIFIVDSNVAYIAGWFDTVLKTTNGGANWVIMRAAPSGQGKSNESLHFWNANSGIIVGRGNRYLKTTDGGDSFSEHYISSYDIFDVKFKDMSTGIMTSSGVDTWKTTNGGENWNFISMPIGAYIPDFLKLSVSNNKFVWAIDYGSCRVFKSSDFGDSWLCIDTIAVGSGQIRMYQACFADSLTGFACGNQGRLYKSTDGGFNWVRENSGYFPPAFMASMTAMNVPENKENPTAWICGGAGKIIKTTNGGQVYTDIINNNLDLPSGYELSQNYPNPFNPTTTINYKISERGFVSIKVFDITGKQISSLENEMKGVGNYTVQFNASSLPSGTYFYRMQINDFIETKKMILLK
ncbi:hypothetical protein BH10BAC5_BH10BAC5_29370 [soil metagenome]